MTDTNIAKKDALKTYVGDVHALVSHGMSALKRQAANLEKDNHKDARPAVTEGIRVLEQQSAALESCLASLGGSATAPLKDAVAAVAGIAAGLINAVRPSEAVKSLRDTATFFSGLGIAYLLLYTTAKGLDDVETADLAQQGYQASAKMVMHLDRVLPHLTVEDLREQKLDVAEVSQQVNAMVANAWKRVETATA
jgi:ferritin-like metal-binding protein YciE